MTLHASESSMPFKYWAFISYSSKDEKWGKWLIDKIETYRVPRQFAGKPGQAGAIPKRLYPVFRDRDELRVGSNLEQELTAALQQSRFLIVVCSPNAADPNSWVDNEVAMFKAMGRQDDVLALIVDGEPNASDNPALEALECFPRSLRFRVNSDGSLSSEQVEPLAADVRPGREADNSRDAKRKAFLKIVAKMIDVGFDDLEQRDRQRRNRHRMVMVTAVVVLVSILGVILESWLSVKKTSLSEQLAQEAISKLESERELAFLLSAYSYRIEDTPVAVGSLLTTIRDTPHLLKYLDHDTQVEAVAFSPDEDELAIATCENSNEDSSCSAQLIRFYKLNSSGQERPGIQLQEGAVSHLLFRPEFEELIVATTERKVLFFNLAKESDITRSWTMDDPQITAIAASADGRLVAIGLSGGEFKLYEMDAGRQCAGASVIGQRGVPISEITFASGAKRVAVANGQGQLLILEPATCKTQTLYLGESRAPSSFAFNEAGDVLLTAMPDGTVSRWKVLQDGAVNQTVIDLPTHLLNDYMHVFSLNAAYMASKHDREIRVFDIARRIELQSILQSSDPGLVGEISVKNTLDRMEPWVLNGHSYEPLILRFSPAGNMLVSVDEEGTILLWELNRNPLSQSLPFVPANTQLHPATQGAISMDGEIRAFLTETSEGCGGDYKLDCHRRFKLVITDVKSDHEIGQVIAYESGYSSIALELDEMKVGFTPDGKVVTRIGGELILWNVDPESLVDIACRMAKRRLEDNELKDRLGTPGWWLFGRKEECHPIVRIR